MKKYLDIDNLREEELIIKPDLIRERNNQAFEPGDYIQITEKIDGSNASFRYDPEQDKLIAFSRNTELVGSNTLNGFYEFVQSLPVKHFNDDRFIYFGEWTGARNKIVYDNDARGRWYLFDIYYVPDERWLMQDYVQAFARTNGFDSPHIFYEGPFISWDHVRSFCNSPSYGDTQEGVVVKNQDKLNDSHYPTYLKIVNQAFKESKIKPLRDPVTEEQKRNEKLLADSIAEQIVTENRVAKMLTKMRDEGLLPETLSAKDMGVIAKNLPDRIFYDCLKEELEMTTSMGAHGYKSISSRTMAIARKMVLG